MFYYALIFRKHSRLVLTALTAQLTRSVSTAVAPAVTALQTYE